MQSSWHARCSVIINFYDDDFYYKYDLELRACWGGGTTETLGGPSLSPPSSLLCCLIG